MVRKFAFAMIALVFVLGLALYTGATGTLANAAGQFGYGQPPTPTSVTSPQQGYVCKETNVSTYSAPVGPNQHIFRGGFNGSQQANPWDLTPNLQGQASYSADSYCNVVYVFNGDLYLISSTGGKPLQLTQNAGANHPDWMKNGVIIYDAGGSLWTVNMDGTNPTKLTAGDNPVFMPNGVVAYQNNGDVWFWNGTSRDSKVAGTPIAWSMSGLIYSNSGKLELLSFPDGKVTDIAATDFVSDPTARSQPAGIGVTPDGLSWFNPQQLLVAGSQPDWWKSTNTFDVGAFDAYLATLPQ